uniref:C2 domain-containing protein n=1 Tax=Eutreptiella gymnastica TaxID=73025 RepID=A0A7S4CYR8_9EUGL
MDMDGTSDPYVVIDSGFQKWQSKPVMSTLLPIWDEEVVIGVINHATVDSLALPEHLQQDYIEISVWDHDLASDDVIASHRIPFADIPGYDEDCIIDEPKATWYEMQQESSWVDDIMGSDLGQWVQSLLKPTPRTERRRSSLLKLEHEARRKSVSIDAETAPKPAIKKDHWKTVADKVFKRQHEFAGAHDESKRGQGSCKVKLAIWFDNKYLPKSPPLLGQLMLRLQNARVHPRDNDEGRNVMIVLQYGRHWVRVPSIKASGNGLAVFDQKFTIGVHDPGTVLTVGVFDDCSDNLLATKPQFLGLFRIRTCTLASNEWFEVDQPLYRLINGEIWEKGRVKCSIYFQCNKYLQTIAAMFACPLPDLAYYHPLTEEWKDAIDTAMQDFEIALMTAQPEELGFCQEMVLHVRGPVHVKFSMTMFKANIARLKDALGPIGDLAGHFDDICEWKNFRLSLGVNVLGVLLIWYYMYIPHLVMGYLLYSFVKGYWNNEVSRHIDPMDVQLYGGVKGQKESEAAEAEEQTEKEEEEPEEEESKGAFEQMRQQYNEAMNLLTGIQNTLGAIADVLERLGAMPHWNDPRISLLCTVLFGVVLAVFNFLPLKTILSVVVLFVLRHPSLRDPIPPPPINMVERLPSRGDKMFREYEE